MVNAIREAAGERTTPGARLAAIERLGAVSREADRALQDLVDDTREILGADLCMANLMLADSLYFRAWSGDLPEDLVVSREIPADRSVCPVVVQTEAPHVIGDLARDEAFSEHPAHTEAKLRFYAGAPLETSEGEVIGTLCVFGKRPAKFEGRDLATLTAFSKAVMARLELLSALEKERRARQEEARQGEELQRVLDHSLDVIAIVGFDGEIRRINRACVEVFGWEPREVVGRRLLEFVLPEDREQAVEDEKKVRQGRSESLIQSRFVGRDGSVTWVEWSASPVAEKEVYYCFARDITARRLAEEQMHQTEVKYQALIENNPAVTYVQNLDAEGSSSNTTYISPRLKEILGYTPDEWTKNPAFWKTKLHPEDRERVLAEDARTDETGEPFKIEYRTIAKDGSVVWLRDEASLVRDDDGRPAYWLGIQYDVTDRKRTEEELRRTEETYRSIFENSLEGVFQISREGFFTTVNPAMASIFGYDSPEQMVREVTDISSQLHVHRESEERLYDTLQSSGRASKFSLQMRRRDGSAIWVSVSVHFTRGPDAEITGLEGIVEDVTERLRLEEARRESEERFRQLFEQSVDALLVHDERGRVIDCNTEACRSLGYRREEMLSMAVRDFSVDLLPEEKEPAQNRERDTLWGRALSGDPGRIAGFHRGRHRRKDGETFPVEVGVGAIDYDGRRLIFASARDVTEQRSFERRLSHLASHDLLTDLPNRLLFMERLDESLFGRDGDSPEGYAALLYLDLDDFKSVNDSFGHQVGDELLVQVARRLQSCVRDLDTVARLGGDEFAILLPNVPDPVHAERVAGCVRAAFDSPFAVQGKTISLGCSAGLVYGKVGSLNPTRVLRESDREMYLDKARRKNAPYKYRAPHN